MDNLQCAIEYMQTVNINQQAVNVDLANQLHTVKVPWISVFGEDVEQSHREGADGEVVLSLDPLDLIRLIGTFSEPSGIETWEIWQTHFEKPAAQNHIPQEKWQRMIPDMLRGKAKVYVEAKGKVWKKDLSYEEVDEVLSCLFQEHDVKA